MMRQSSLKNQTLSIRAVTNAELANLKGFALCGSLYKKQYLHMELLIGELRIVIHNFYCIFVLNT